MTPRLVLLTEIPAPYRIPLFNALADRLDLRVVFLRQRNPQRPYRLHEDELRFRWTILPGLDVTIGRYWLVVNRGIGPQLRDADVVLLGGWNQPAFWQALATARRRGIRSIAWVESTGPERRRSTVAAKRVFVRNVDAFVTPGRAAADYLAALGVTRERVTIAANAVDGEIFGSQQVETHEHDRCRVLAVGRLAPEKGIDVLLRAVDGLPIDVVLVGSGPAEQRLRNLAGPNVTFLGHLDRDRLPAVYASADVLAMPSLVEPWGMALNEAALAGLPLVSTDAAGAAHELIEDGVNGFRVPAGDVAALRDALLRLSADADFRARAGARSRELAARFTPQAWADAVATLASTLAAP